MKTFGRALYLLVVEAFLLPLQLIALPIMYIYYVVENMIDGGDFATSVKIANGLWAGAADGVKILINFVKYGKVTF